MDPTFMVVNLRDPCPRLLIFTVSAWPWKNAFPDTAALWGAHLLLIEAFKAEAVSFIAAAIASRCSKQDRKAALSFEQVIATRNSRNSLITLSIPRGN